jgi:hypothetical protein
MVRFFGFTTALAVTLAVGCGHSAGGGVSAGSPLARPAQASPPAQTTPPWTMPPGGPLTPALRLDVARLLAPQLRFNAYHNDGNTSAQNRSVDFFPMSVANFLRELESGSVRVVTTGSNGTSPGVSDLLPLLTPPVLGVDSLTGVPRDMVGDPPGTAPAYAHVYEDATARRISADGSGELRVFVEHWFFYCQDRAETPILGIPSGTGFWDLFGHIGDWEHTLTRVHLRLGPDLSLQTATIEAATYYLHEDAYRVAVADLELVDDQGQPSASGTHPVVYVSQGKHASYPQAGEWWGLTYPGPIVGYTGFFRGNGVVVDTWLGLVFDLEEPAAAPAEFSPPELTSIMARSPVQGLSDWTEYWGRWGPDTIALFPFRFSLASPVGPKFQQTYGDYGLASRDWAALKASDPDLIIYRDLGVVTPPLVPTPTPIRR